MILWRISDHRSLDGRGGLVAAGRWHIKGRPIVYLAESSALAMLEVLVHLEVDEVPQPFQLIKVEAPDDLAVEHHSEERTGDPSARAWGEAWLVRGKTALAQVPSRIAPGASNWLLNPLHSESARVKIIASSHYPWNQRLFRN